MFQIECIMSIYDNNIYISVNISSHNLISVSKFFLFCPTLLLLFLFQIEPNRNVKCGISVEYFSYYIFGFVHGTYLTKLRCEKTILHDLILIKWSIELFFFLKITLDNYWRGACWLFQKIKLWKRKPPGQPKRNRRL